ANEQRIPYGNNISPWSNLVTFTIAGAAQSSRAPSVAAAQSTSSNGLSSSEPDIVWLPDSNALSTDVFGHGATRQAVNQQSNFSSAVDQEDWSPASGDFRIWTPTWNLGSSRDVGMAGANSPAFDVEGTRATGIGELLDRDGVPRFANRSLTNPLRILELNALDAVFADYETK
ncbi:MAG: hypothetical protein O3A00_01580, partial [Planctomycetota bacterium]|nr:hypothetical protein [Planctomycetota bacterium]